MCSIIGAFIDEIPANELESYAQLLHNKDVLVSTLLKYINNEVSPFSHLLKVIPASFSIAPSFLRIISRHFSRS